VTRTRALLGRIHDLPAPAGLRRLPDPTSDVNPWEAIAADPQRLLRLQVCEPAWLDAHLDELRAAAADAPTAGQALVHLDVHAANLWHQNGRLVLVDWAAAAVGNPWLDHHTWLMFLHAEGGPPPEAQQGPHAAGHAALIAGQQPLLAPSRDANPVLFAARRRYLTVALGWAARLLGIAPPRQSLPRSDQ
jgi:aminoglycoside phosphotransferase (APT) family kinase protein